jgi:uncharacterized membrane protein YeaQ/YmgE (transglycosylase-associated protein family)
MLSCTLFSCDTQVWLGGAKGLALGIATGFIGSTVAQSMIRSSYRSTSAVKYLDRRYTFLATMLCGAIGSFSGSTIFGKRSVVYIGDVFTRGATEQTLTGYQERSAEAGGGARAQELRLQQAMRESHGRRMQALQQHKSKRNSGASSGSSSDDDDDANNRF